MKTISTEGLKTKTVSLFLIGLIFLSSCASTTTIQSIPSGAYLYLNNEPVGITPYTHTDTKIVGSTNYVSLEMEGYEPLHTSFSRNEEVDVGAIIGGVFLWFPFLWTMKYKPVRTYELSVATEYKAPPGRSQAPQAQSRAERLRELKYLYEEQLITREEYEEQRKRVLEEEKP